jgi:hypothetical protein
MSDDNSLEMSLYRTDWICDKVKQDRFYAQNLYAAMCNQEWQRKDVWDILRNNTWSCTWRYAGGIVARITGQGDYMDWYCSGIQDFSRDEADPNFGVGMYVNEGVVTQEIREDLAKLGWVPVEES